MGTSTQILATHLLAAPQKSSGFGGSTEIILVVVVLAGLYFLILRPNQRRQKQAQQQQNSLRPGARVTTIGGMRGLVTAVDQESGDVVLEVAPGVEVRYIKQAIRTVDSPGDEPEEPEAPEDEADTEAPEDEDETVAAETESDDEDGTVRTGDPKQDAAIADAAKSSGQE